MPYADLKVPAGTLTTASKKRLQDAVTDAFANVHGERARATTPAILEEVTDGGRSLGGTILNEHLPGRSRPMQGKPSAQGPQGRPSEGSARRGPVAPSSADGAHRPRPQGRRPAAIGDVAPQPKGLSVGTRGRRSS